MCSSCCVASCGFWLHGCLLFFPCRKTSHLCECASGQERAPQPHNGFRRLGSGQLGQLFLCGSSSSGRDLVQMLEDQSWNDSKLPLHPLVGTSQLWVTIGLVLLCLSVGTLIFTSLWVLMNRIWRPLSEVRKSGLNRNMPVGGVSYPLKLVIYGLTSLPLEILRLPFGWISILLV